VKIESFTNIEAWEQARIFVADVYHIFLQGNSQRDFGFRDQIQRASVSIMSNIAESFDCNSKKIISSISNLFISLCFRS